MGRHITLNASPPTDGQLFFVTDLPLDQESDDDPPPVPAVFAGRSNWDALILLGLFVVGQRFGDRFTGEDTGLMWAIGFVSAWGVFSIFRRWRAGAPIGKFLPLILVYLVTRGTLGIVFASTDVYFGIGIGTKVLVGLVLIGSIFVGKPLMAVLVPLLFPFNRRTKEHPIYRSTMVHLTWFAAAFEILTSVWDVWLLTNSTATGYVLIRFVVGMLTGFGTFFAAFFYTRWKLDQIPGFEGMFPMIERMATEMGKPQEPA